MNGIQEIDVQIDRAGNVSVEVRGASGKQCEELTAVLEQALGGVVVERSYKPEYYQDETASQSDKLSSKA